MKTKQRNLHIEAFFKIKSKMAIKPNFILFFLSLPLSIFAQKQAVLVKDGLPQFSIIVAVKPAAADEKAAILLQSAIKKIAGCELPIVKKDKPNIKNSIYITPLMRSDPSRPGGTISNLPKGLKKHFTADFEAKKKELINDAFLISIQKDNILLVSGGKKGAIYGVVHLLEKYLGCRMYAPEVEIMPPKNTIVLPVLCEMDKPVNSIRIVNGALTQQNEAYRNWQRLNDHHEEFAKGYYVHTFNRLVPWETFFEQHPEYFALMGGKRIIDQLCLTNPDVFDLTIKKLKEEMAKQPEKTWWSVSQGDNFSYCQCDQCAKIIADEGSAAGPIIHFVNKVAAQFPDKMISTLAYQYSRKAPKYVKPADNVQIMLCTIELNRSKDIENDPLSISFLKDITDWGKISKNIYLWDYTVNFSHHITPFPNLHTLQKNIQFFTKNSVNAHFQQTNAGMGHEFSELKAYLIARLLWNPNINADSVMTDFLNGYYGAGGVFIQQYIHHMTTEIKKSGEWLDIYGHPVTHASTFLSAENMAQYNQYFDAAENAVKETPSVTQQVMAQNALLLQRVKTCRLPIQYAMLEIGKSDMFGARGFYTENYGKFILNPPMQQLLEDFYTVCKQNGVENVNEAGLTPEAYYQSTKRFINVQVEGNSAFRKKITADPTPSPKYSQADLTILTNGVQGANDFKAHWLGWEAQDFDLLLDLQTAIQPQSIQISTLYDPKSWILHPKSVTCSVSEDGVTYRLLETQSIEGEQRKENVTHNFSFDKNIGTCRYIKFEVKGTKKLFNWHPSAGGGSWVFVDEIVVQEQKKISTDSNFKIDQSGNQGVQTSFPLTRYNHQISDVIRTIFQDSKGNIWFGTQNGAFKLTGDSLIHIDSIKGESGKDVTIKDIAEDKDGIIWVGHSDGISSINGALVTNYYESDGLISNDVWCIETDVNGNVWIGTIKGTCIFDGQGFTNFDLPEGKKDTTVGVSSTKMIHSILEDSKGTIWFCTNAGLFSYTNNKLKDISDEVGIQTNFINEIVEDKKGEFWISTSTGLFHLKGNILTNITAMHFEESIGTGSIIVDYKGDIWFNCGRSIYRLNGDKLTEYRIEEGNYGPLTFQIYEDRQSRLWFVGFGGAYRYENDRFIKITQNGPW